MEKEEKIRELLQTFDAYEGRYRREEMEEAVVLRQEITPHLIKILDDLAANPLQYDWNDHYANTYAVALLAYFQEPAAHVPIIRAFLVEEDILDALWGDMVTGTLPTLLVQTCNGSLEEIKKLVLNKEANEYVRGAAVQAMTYAVGLGVAERQEVVAFFSELFTGEEAEEDSYLWSAIAASLADLHPAEVIDVIRNAYAKNLIHPGYVALQEIEKDCLRSQEEVLEVLRKKVERDLPQDVHGYLSWFACFNEERGLSSSTWRRDDERRQREGKKSQKLKKAAKRSKKKMAKKSKRKNRKK